MTFVEEPEVYLEAVSRFLGLEGRRGRRLVDHREDMPCLDDLAGARIGRSVTSPSRVAAMWFSIFIASRMQILRPP